MTPPMHPASAFPPNPLFTKMKYLVLEVFFPAATSIAGTESDDALRYESRTQETSCADTRLTKPAPLLFRRRDEAGCARRMVANWEDVMRTAFLLLSTAVAALAATPAQAQASDPAGTATD